MTRLLALLLIALPLAAEPIDDVRTALRRLSAREPIRATYEVQRAVANEGKFANDKSSGTVSVELEGDANGFRVVFPRTLLDQIDREQDAESRDPKFTMPTVGAVKEIDPVETSQALDFAPVLLRLMEGAKVVSDGAGTWAGKPARVMVFRLLDEPHDGPGKVTVLENRLTLWLGADLVPVAAEHIAAGKFSLLVLKGESRQKESWHLSRVADRLVPHRHEFTRTSSGLGQKGNERVVATVRVH